MARNDSRDPFEATPQPGVVHSAPLPAPIARRIETEIELRFEPVPELEGDRAAIERFLRAAINEESTDALIDLARGLAPFGSGWLLARVLDALLPEKLLYVALKLARRLTG